MILSPPVFFRSHRWTLYLVGLAAIIFPLASEEAGAAARARGDFFDWNRVLEIRIKIATNDWKTLCRQEREIKAEFSKERLDRMAPKPYTWFKADVLIDGTLLTNVGIRKRGFFGSTDNDRPALNLDLDRFVKGQEIEGQRGLKLHNNKQDGSNVRQALAYSLFTAAGVPAPRCNFAHVTVNGRDLGIYSNLERIDRPFLKRVFGSGKGNLYEAQISDFRPGWTRTFEKKNNAKSPERDDLDAVAEALRSDDSQLIERLGRILDIDAFITFWAMESLMNHWDGFAGHLNNAFVYHDPKSGKLRFIAWGADSTFGEHHIFVPFEPPASVWAVSFLARRLYNHPVTREKYRNRMRELLKGVWDEKRLDAEVTRLSKIAAVRSTVPNEESTRQVGKVRKFIRDRRAEVDAELNRPAKPWNYPMRRELYVTSVGKISGDFDTRWTAHIGLPAPKAGKGSATIEFYGRQFRCDFDEIKATQDPGDPNHAAVFMSGKLKGVTTPLTVALSIGPEFFHGGRTLTNETERSLLFMAGDYGTKDWRILGFGGDGAARLKQAESKNDARVSGSFEIELTNLPWDDFDLTQLKKAP